MRCQEVVLRRTSLEEQVTERYRDVELGKVVYEYHLRPLFGAEEEKRATELRGLIERMGEINLTAIEESEELQKRFDFLTAQKADLESAIEQLETAIERINRDVARALPRDVRRGQREVPGGVPAHVRRRARQPGADRREDMLETGIEIVAHPPGKKVSQNIELLSGGEKALTAVSLLFAIFLVKPSPFCVLDEVDAPLDEANVGRFNEVVREMTDRSQFILITPQQAHHGDRRPAVRRHHGRAGRLQAGGGQPARRQRAHRTAPRSRPNARDVTPMRSA